MKNTKLSKKIMASALVLATAVGATWYAFADDTSTPNNSSGGHGNGNGGTTPGISVGGENEWIWRYRESFGAPTVENVYSTIESTGTEVEKAGPAGQNTRNLTQNALNQAVAQCQARGGTNCRLVGIGFMKSEKANLYTAVNYWNEAQSRTGFTTAWFNETDNKTYTHTKANGSQYSYNVNDNWKLSNGGSMSVSSLAREGINRVTKNTELIVLVLDDKEPQLDYHLSVSTQQQGGFSESGSTTPVHDSIMTSNDAGQSESLNASVWLHWDGFGHQPRDQSRARSSQPPATHTALISRPAFRVVACGLRTRSTGILGCIRVCSLGGSRDAVNKELSHVFLVQFSHYFHSVSHADYYSHWPSNPVSRFSKRPLGV